MKERIFDAATGETIERDLTAEEIAAAESEALQMAWAELRFQRNARLAACDWTVLSDTPTLTTAWKVYRQALRDLPANTTDPFEPVWPTPPA